MKITNSEKLDIQVASVDPVRIWQLVSFVVFFSLVFGCSGKQSDDGGKSGIELHGIYYVDFGVDGKDRIISGREMVNGEMKELDQEEIDRRNSKPQ